MQLQLRDYDRDRDLDAVARIWRETGWIDDEDHEKPLARFLDTCSVEVALIDDVAECAAAWVSGKFRYQHIDLPLAVIAAVTTSRIARRLGFASALTARAVRAAAESGYAMATLGIFDQGFYDRFGFGVGAYTHALRFDPASLQLDHIPYRTPVRLTPDDSAEFYELVARRHRTHGGVLVEEENLFRSELEWLKPPITLGYRNETGRLTHALIGEQKGEHGPDRYYMFAYEEPAQVLELLRLIREFSDQAHTVEIWEPPHIQLQDLIRRPFDQERRTVGAAHFGGNRAGASKQFRIVDLASTVAGLRSNGPNVVCNLELSDPVAAALVRADQASGERAIAGRWSGLDGIYRLTIGASSSVESMDKSDPTLPTLRASIGAFTRCWTGALPASSLALTTDLSAPDDLIEALDEALRLPVPKSGWMY